jgi:outer membrane protein OmpA-like peptidoglycan-associated protein
MKYSILAVALATALTGCAGTATRDQLDIQDTTVLQRGFGAQQDAASGAAVKQWTDIYTQIKHRGDVLARLQGKLDSFGPKKDSYVGAKAQCWINAGKEALSKYDEWGFVEEAIGEAARLTVTLDSDDSATSGNQSLRTVAKLRPDLWNQLTKLRADPRFGYCPQARKLVACSEVELMYAGHEAWTRAFNKAQTRIDGLQGQLRAGEQALAVCAIPAESKQPLSTTVSLSADALFEFDRGNIAAIKAEGRQRLDDIATRLQGVDLTQRIVVSGYTDRLGSTAHNLRLSQQRADSVARYLKDRGVTIPVDAQGYGNAHPGTSCSMHDRQALIECLAPDRRVDIRFVGQKPVVTQ